MKEIVISEGGRVVTPTWPLPFPTHGDCVRSWTQYVSMADDLGLGHEARAESRWCETISTERDYQQFLDLYVRLEDGKVRQPRKDERLVMYIWVPEKKAEKPSPVWQHGNLTGLLLPPPADLDLL